MSDLAEKLAPAQRTGNTKARARLEQLLLRWGSPDSIDASKPPDLVFVRVLLEKKSECWKRISPFNEKAKALYELVDTIDFADPPVDGEGAP